MPSRLTECGELEVDSSGVIVDANDALLRWIGAERADVVGSPVESVLSIRLPTGMGEGPVPPDATLRTSSGANFPVVVGRLSGSDSTPTRRMAVFDLSPGSLFGQAFRGGGTKTERGLLRLQILLGAAVGFAEVRTELQAAELLVDVARRAFAATAASAHLQIDGRMRHVAGTNPLAEHWPPGSKPPGAVTLSLGEVIVVSSPDETARFVPDVQMADVFKSAGIHAAIASPLQYKGHAIGALICYFDHPRVFDEEAVPLAEALANQAAQAIARVRLEEELRRDAMHDQVTGLPGRRLVEEELAQSPLPGAGGLCAVFIDLDNFKNVNDRLGHVAGDALLAEVGARLQSTVREGDRVGRFGGDEFIAIAQVDAEDDATALAERIRVAVAQPYPGIPSDLAVTASIGVALSGTSGPDIVFDQLVRIADHAMYEAKTAGGDRIALSHYPE